MSHWGQEDPFIETLLPASLTGLKVMDVGTGFGKTGYNIREWGYRRGQPQLYGIEIFKPYADHVKSLGYYTYVFNQDALMPFPFMVDISLLQHTIEHSDKEKGKKILSNIEKYTKSLVIVACPYGYTESPEVDNNPDNPHVSGWLPDDFKELGYDVFVHRVGHPSRAVLWFGKLWYRLRGRLFSYNDVIVAWKRTENHQDETD